ncbi:MAG: rRNA adenine N-6-methyltransferase family protein, partial [candidate division WOR-3 bacterium]
LIAKPNSPNYCAMTVLFQFYTECQKILNIRPTEFKPQPKVTSSAILIKKNPTPLFNDITYHSFSKIVQIAFSYPRKTIANNLSLKLTIDKNLLRQIPNLNLNKRAQNYSLFEYYLLTKHLKSLVNL